MDEQLYKPSDVAAAILAIPGEELPSLDALTFGASGQETFTGKTDGKYYQAIAEAINRKKVGRVAGKTTITIAAPTGATVTAEKDGKTYAGVESVETPGEFSIKAPDYGLYDITVAAAFGTFAFELAVVKTETNIQTPGAGYEPLSSIVSTGHGSTQSRGSAWWNDGTPSVIVANYSENPLVVEMEVLPKEGLIDDYGSGTYGCYFGAGNGGRNPTSSAWSGFQFENGTMNINNGTWLLSVVTDLTYDEWHTIRVCATASLGREGTWYEIDGGERVYAAEESVGTTADTKAYWTYIGWPAYRDGDSYNGSNSTGFQIRAFRGWADMEKTRLITYLTPCRYTDEEGTESIGMYDVVRGVFCDGGSFSHKFTAPEEVT